jgi:hypothetical protein
MALSKYTMLMKIDVRQIVKDYAGKDLTENEPTEEKGRDGKTTIRTIKKPITLRTLLASAIQRQKPNADPTKPLPARTAEEQAKIHQLCLKLFNHNKVEFTPKEIAFIQEKVEELDVPIYTGRVSDIFEHGGQKTPPVDIDKEDKEEEKKQ